MDIQARDQAVTRPLTRVLVGTKALFGSCLVQSEISWLCLLKFLLDVLSLESTAMQQTRVSSLERNSDITRGQSAFRGGLSRNIGHYANAKAIMSGAIQGAKIDTSSLSCSRSSVNRPGKRERK